MIGVLDLKKFLHITVVTVSYVVPYGNDSRYTFRYLLKTTVTGTGWFYGRLVRIESLVNKETKPHENKDVGLVEVPDRDPKFHGSSKPKRTHRKLVT